MSSQQSDYTPSQIARPGEDPEYVGYAIAHDNYEIQKAEQKRDADDEDYLMPDSQEESQDDYDPSPSQETQSSQASHHEPSGSQREQTPPYGLADDDDEWTNEANGDAAGTGHESAPSSQNPVYQGEALANGKLDGEKLCKIAQIYKARRATGPQEAFLMIPPEWDFIVKVLYGLTEEEMKTTKAFLRANMKTLFRAPSFKPKHWAKAEEEARQTWHIFLEEVRYQHEH